MNTVKVYFEDVRAAESFVFMMRQFDGEYDLTYGSHTVDAKSILGVFAIGIGKVMDLILVNPRGETQKVLSAVERYRRAA